MTIAAACATLLTGGLMRSAAVLAQSSSSQPGASQSGASQSGASQSGASSSTPDSQAIAPVVRIAQPEAGGSAITLETSEPLFYLATALNACGYDAGLAESSPVRRKIRDEVNQALAGSAPARDARDALCTFIREHALNDPSRSLAQYVSLALYLSPPPLLTPTVDQTQLPPDSGQVVEVLPLVRTFAETVHLHALWFQHRPEYEGFIDRIHAPMTKMVLDTNFFLHMPVSSYEGRRFLVLLEPMLSPAETNARYNGVDSVVVVSPAGEPADRVPMDLIRHTYLHFVVEPMIYSRYSAGERLLPLLKAVQAAPLEFIYKSDVTALLTECLIKAIEAQTMDVGIARPQRPDTVKDRSDSGRYLSLVAAYERQAEVVRQKAVALDMRQGWVLADYFYNQLGILGKDGTSLKENIGPMVYGMEVGREAEHARHIAFLPAGSGGDRSFRDPVHRTARPLAGLDLAEVKLMKGDVKGAGEIADDALKTDPQSAQAHYLLGRIDLMEGHPDEAHDHLTQAMHLSRDPRTIAWAHIYLGRMYDIAHDPHDPEVILPERSKAIAEYRAALENRDSQPDTKAAAEKGLHQPFILPKRTVVSTDQPADTKGSDSAPGGNSAPSGDSGPLDPTGKAEKESYRPTPPK